MIAHEGFVHKKSEEISQMEGQQTKFIFSGGSSDSASMMRWIHDFSEE